jgi:hypothetical protein
MLEEMLEHMDNRRGSAWRHSLLGAPGVDFFDQQRFDPDIDIRSFSSHVDEVGRCRAWPLDNLGQKFDTRLVSTGMTPGSQNTPSRIAIAASAACNAKSA